jgi:hypothetical protein
MTRCSGRPSRTYLAVLQNESVSASRHLLMTRSSSTTRVLVCSSPFDDQATETVSLEPQHHRLHLESVGGADADPCSLMIEPPLRAGVRIPLVAALWPAGDGPSGGRTSVTSGKWGKLIVIRAQIPPGAKSTMRSRARRGRRAEHRVAGLARRRWRRHRLLRPQRVLATGGIDGDDLGG